MIPLVLAVCLGTVASGQQLVLNEEEEGISQLATLLAALQQQHAAAFNPSARPGADRYSTSKTSHRSSPPVGKWTSYSAPVRKAPLLVRLFRKRPKPKAIELFYFNIKAHPGEKIRLALALAGVPFEDHRVSRTEWEKLKPNTKYGQLPMMKIDGVEKYQSPSLLRYAGRLGDGSLYPVHDTAKKLKIEEMIGLCDDFAREYQPALLMGFSHTRYGHPKDWPEPEKKAVVQRMHKDFLEKVFPKFMGLLSSELEQTGAFLTGRSPTIADCQWLAQVNSFTSGVDELIPTDCLKDYPVITRWIKRMMALPRIKKYYEKQATSKRA
jgi:glutathione S-transferase